MIFILPFDTYVFAGHSRLRQYYDGQAVQFLDTSIKVLTYVDVSRNHVLVFYGLQFRLII